MDSLKTRVKCDWTPPEVPLARPIQSLDQPHKDETVPAFPARQARTFWWRISAFVPAILTTLGVIAALTNWFVMDGFSVLEGVIVGLITITFFWIALSLSTATLGVGSLLLRRKPALQTDRIAALDVALLVPVYNEDPVDVFGNAAAMMMALSKEQSAHRFSLFILSDTRNAKLAEQEETAFQVLRAQLPEGANIYYRRRAENIDAKLGNLAEWTERWGGAYEAMVVLDADSLMSGRAIVALSDALARDPAAGLIQSFPTLFGAESVFGRVQQFSNRIYGAALAEGLAKWTGREGNYWGHNAIMRSRAFASCAGLPRLQSRGRAKAGPGKLILSHDFVEAGLLRRAGWSVRFLPQIEGSYEEVPPTLIDYVLRDRRWCQGNLQHLSLIDSRGFHAVSRFHLVNGAMGYLMSPAWFLLMVVWALVGNGQNHNVVQYFSGYDPQVNWPQMSGGNSFAILIFMYAMLLAPKVLSALAIPQTGVKMRDLGGPFQFAASLLFEIILSIAYAPVLMVQQSIAVVRIVLGWQETWKPQNRKGGDYSWAVLAKFHCVETVTGMLLLLGMTQGIVTLWLLPIGLSLAAAIPLSALSGVNLKAHRWSARQMGTPEAMNAPPIIRQAMRHRRKFAQYLSPTGIIPAE